MTLKGKSINLFLMDGTATGRVKCTLANWNGVAYKIPRTELDKCKDRPDLKSSGVYFLFGVSDETGIGVVYIGQACSRKNGEGVLYRLLEHKRSISKDYWSEAIVFTSSNNWLGPTEISFLENKFFNLAKDAGRYEVKNGNDPTIGNVTEEKESELEEFVENAKVIMGVLGHQVFNPLTRRSAQNMETQILDCKEGEKLSFTGKKAKGEGMRTSDGFVVFKGSVLNPTVARSCPKNTINNRKKYASAIDENGAITENLLFNSPSAAASFLSGTSVSGMSAWRLGKKTLHDLEIQEST